MIEFADRVAEAIFVVVIVTAVLFGIVGRVRRGEPDIANSDAIESTEAPATSDLTLLANCEETNKPHSNESPNRSHHRIH
jgi:hypothetical protein